MAGGLNKEFLRDPVAFLGRHFILVQDQGLQTGAARVGFYANGPNVLLRPFPGDPGRYQHPIDCYFLLAVADSENPGHGFAASHADYFFTSTLSGCQFLAHGPSSAALTVAHNNCLSNPGGYAAYAAAMPAAAVRAQVHNGGLYDITQGHCGNVVGVHGANGWAMYFQRDAPGQALNVKQIV